jgi:DNA-binding CsgD family transcriptional regulator
LEKLNEIIHKDDRNFSIETELMGYNILMSLPLDERKKFWLRFSQRLKNINGLYCYYVITIKVYSFDAEANPHILVIETKCLPDTYKPEKLHFREFSHSLNKKKKQSEWIIKRLTNLEIELLNLIHKGFTTKEIAKFSSKSEHTIKNQRKGILRKLDVKNTIIAYDVANKLDLL